MTKPTESDEDGTTLRQNMRSAAHGEPDSVASDAVERLKEDGREQTLHGMRHHGVGSGASALGFPTDNVDNLVAPPAPGETVTLNKSCIVCDAPTDGSVLCPECELEALRKEYVELISAVVKEHDALTAAEAENERLEGSRDEWEACAKHYVAENARLREALTQVPAGYEEEIYRLREALEKIATLPWRGVGEIAKFARAALKEKGDA